MKVMHLTRVCLFNLSCGRRFVHVEFGDDYWWIGTRHGVTHKYYWKHWTKKKREDYMRVHDFMAVTIFNGTSRLSLFPEYKG